MNLTPVASYSTDLTRRTVEQSPSRFRASNMITPGTQQSGAKTKSSKRGLPPLVALFFAALSSIGSVALTAKVKNETLAQQAKTINKQVAQIAELTTNKDEAALADKGIMLVGNKANFPFVRDPKAGFAYLIRPMQSNRKGGLEPIPPTAFADFQAKTTPTINALLGQKPTISKAELVKDLTQSGFIGANNQRYNSLNAAGLSNMTVQVIAYGPKTAKNAETKIATTPNDLPHTVQAMFADPTSGVYSFELGPDNLNKK